MTALGDADFLLSFAGEESAGPVAHRAGNVI